MLSDSVRALLRDTAAFYTDSMFTTAFVGALCAYAVGRVSVSAVVAHSHPHSRDSLCLSLTSADTDAWPQGLSEADKTAAVAARHTRQQQITLQLKHGAGCGHCVELVNCRFKHAGASKQRRRHRRRL